MRCLGVAEATQGTDSETPFGSKTTMDRISGSGHEMEAQHEYGQYLSKRGYMASWVIYQ